MSLAQPALRQEQEFALNEMGSLLSSCHSIHDVENAAEHWVPRIFPGWSAALLLVDGFDCHRSDAHATAGRLSFTAADCWALRYGRIRVTPTSERELLCSHLRPTLAGTHFCVPLPAGDEFLGILHAFAPEACAESASSAEDRPDSKEVLAGLASRLSTVLATLRVKPALSTTPLPRRDSLTGLFSRSHVEESLEREIVRAEVHGKAVSVVIASLDHFERFRDECGDPATQILLQAVAQMIQSQTRPQDVACRYQRGEFALVMPEMVANVARARAEQFRAGIRALVWCHNRTLSAPVTLSAGVASFPDHAANTTSLLRAARGALSRAAECGRDRVMVATAVRKAVA